MPTDGNDIATPATSLFLEKGGTMCHDGCMDEDDMLILAATLYVVVIVGLMIWVGFYSNGV